LPRTSPSRFANFSPPPVRCQATALPPDSSTQPPYPGAPLTHVALGLSSPKLRAAPLEPPADRSAASPHLA